MTMSTVLTGVFSFTVVSILRLPSLVYLGTSSNPTWDLYFIMWWSTFEINIGIICSCLPVMRLVLVCLWPSVFSSSSSSNNLTPRLETIALTTVVTHDDPLGEPTNHVHSEHSEANDEHYTTKSSHEKPTTQL